MAADSARSHIPALRVRALNHRAPRADGRHVLYWMTAFRRAHYNYSLDHAIAWCHRLHRPLLVLEGLRCAYPWASDRLHRFVLQGMADNQAAFAHANITYLPFVEEVHGDGAGLVESLARDEQDLSHGLRVPPLPAEGPPGLPAPLTPCQAARKQRRGDGRGDSGGRPEALAPSLRCRASRGAGRLGKNRHGPRRGPGILRWRHNGRPAYHGAFLRHGVGPLQRRSQPPRR